MRRNFRKKSNYVDSKIITFSIIGVVVLATVVFGILMYGKSLEDSVRNSQLSTEQIASITEEDNNINNQEDTESASTQIGKSVDDATKSLENEEDNSNNNIVKKEDVPVENKNENAQNVIPKVNTNTTNKTVTTTTSNEKTTKNENVVKKELVFQKPVQGEVIQSFAQDSLIFSKTLDEWVTHLGIDIKAEKATVVNSAEEGIVKSIKNDPRYGLTVVVSHQDGFETVYANLLSSEFIKEGDKVTKGQALGTVGNTGVFESAEEPHLHFEILKDSVQVDPSIYLK